MAKHIAHVALAEKIIGDKYMFNFSYQIILC